MRHRDDVDTRGTTGSPCTDGAGRRARWARGPARLGLALALAATLVAGAGCNKKKASGTAAGPEGAGGGAAPAAPGAGDSGVVRLLKHVPADAHTVGAVLDWRGFYQMLADTERALGHTALGRDLVKRARLFAADAPFVLPWTVEELARLGLDPDGPMAVYGRDKPLVMFSVSDGATFKKHLGALWSKGKGSWTTSREGTLELHALSGVQPVTCAFADRRMICSPDRAQVVGAVRRPPARSLWDELDAGERKAAARATALLASRSSGVRGLGTLRVEVDGLTVRVRLAGSPLRRLLGPLGAKGEPRLLGLARGARTAIYARADLTSLMSLGRGVLPSPRELGIDMVRVKTALTGEVLVVERGPSEAVVVVGMKDTGVAGEVVEAVARHLMASAAKGGGAKQGAAARGARVSRVEGKGGPMFKIETTLPLPDLPLELTLGLAAGKAGVLLGSYDAVATMADKEPPDKVAFLDSLDSAAEREAFGPDAVLAGRSYVGDPLGPVADTIKGLLRRNLGPRATLALGGFDLARFVLDQLHRQTFSVVREGPEALALLVRVSTLHRRGKPGDDKARATWAAATARRIEESDEAYRAALESLAAEATGSRYAELKGRQKTGLLGTVLLGAAMASAVPMLFEMRQAGRNDEAQRNLARIAAAAKVARATSAARGAATFPDTTPWSPRTPCCQQEGGLCQPDEQPWQHAGWRALHFSLPRPHRFQYRFVSKEGGFLVEARGDPGCTGKPTVLAIEGEVDKQGNVSFRPPRVVPAP